MAKLLELFKTLADANANHLRWFEHKPTALEVRRELHMAYLDGPWTYETEHRWRRGDIVQLKNGKQVIVWSTHPDLVSYPDTLLNRLRFFRDECVLLFQHIFHKQTPPELSGFDSTVNLGGPAGISFYTRWPRPLFRLPKPSKLKG